MGIHFICYSRRDGKRYADRVCQALNVSPYDFRPWIDHQDRVPGFDYQRDIQRAIRTCDSLLLILTRDSTSNSENCLDELRQAREHSKPILTLRFHRDAERPPHTSGDVIDFPSRADRWEAKIQELYKSLLKIESPAGKIRQIEAQIEAVRHKLTNARGAQERQLQQRLDGLQQQVSKQLQLSENEASSAERLHQAIEDSLAEEHAREPPQSVASGVLQLPGPLPSIPAEPTFRDRDNEIWVLEHHLMDEEVRLVLVHGREGSGKTRMVLRLLHAVSSRSAKLQAETIVYRSALALRRFTVADLLASLREAAAHDTKPPGTQYPGARTAPSDRLDEVLTQLDRVSVIVAIDDAQELFDPRTRQYRDPFLGEALRTLIHRHDHHVKLVLISRTEPKSLAVEVPWRVPRIALDDGLPATDARFLLQELDPNDLMGIEETPGLFERAYRLTGGLPRSLEALYGGLTLPNAQYGSLTELLDAIPSGPPEHVLDCLMAEMFSSLDSQERDVVQALAVYDRPVRSGAIDHLLDARFPREPSASVLERLLSYRLVRRQGARYFLSRTDAIRVRKLIPRGEPSDRDQRPPPFTQLALFHQAADYYGMARQRPHVVTDLEDLGAELAEIDLRLDAEEGGKAFRLLNEVCDEYLDRWGQGHVVMTQRERLVGRLETDSDELRNLADLGDAHALRDDQEAAIDCYHRALTLARKHRWSNRRRKMLVNLGATRAEQGRIQEAVDYFEQARTIALWGAKTRIRVVTRDSVPFADALPTLVGRPRACPPARQLSH
jgi:hypothetical protein